MTEHSRIFESSATLEMALKLSRFFRIEDRFIERRSDRASGKGSVHVVGDERDDSGTVGGF